MVLLSPHPLASAVAIVALILPSTQSLSIKPSPPPQPPKALSSRSSSNVGGRSTTPVRTWNRPDRSVGGRGGSSRQQQPLRAYTVADNRKPSLSFWKLPPPFEKFASQFGSLEDSLFSFEGGGVSGVATRPLMPNLEIETVMVASAIQKELSIDMEKHDLLSELIALKETFSTLESSMEYKSQLFEETISAYEFKANELEEKNTLLEGGLQQMTVILEMQAQQLLEMRQKMVETPTETVEKNTDSMLLLQVQGENEMLRQRVRAVELELSEAAFESRKVMPAPPVAVASSSAAIVAEPTKSTVEASVSVSFQSAKLSPKPPSEAPPTHILQLQQLQMKVEEYERERSSVKKLFGLGIIRGINKVGRALNLWSPVYNLQLWGELRGHGRVRRVEAVEL